MHPNDSAAADAADVHRNAYNAAFHELGLRWFWERDMYDAVLSGAAARDCLRHYLQHQQPHLLRAYDAEFLIDVIHAAKARRYAALTAAGCHGSAYIDWAEIQQVEVGS